ncbi:MAG: hypothetical protein AAGA45_01135 [Verrucomicrobiota bacterium]
MWVTLIYLAPLFIGFELVQLLAAERFIGIKQVRTGIHPLERSQRLPEWMSAIWLLGRLATWAFMIALLFDVQSAIQGFIMISVTLVAIVMRRSLGLKWALVIMTVEGAIRIGLMVNLIMTIFFFDGQLYPRSWVTG